MRNVLVLHFPDPLDHFNYGLKDEMLNIDPNLNGKLCLEP